MRRDVGRHTYGDTRCSVDQKIRESGRKNCRFFLCLVKVRCKIYGIFIDVSSHLHGNLAQTCLCISHGSSAITVYRPKVPVSVNQRISRRPFLCQIYQCSINRAVAMRMIFTHCITNNTRTFTMRLVRSIIQLDH